MRKIRDEPPMSAVHDAALLRTKALEIDLRRLLGPNWAEDESSFEKLCDRKIWWIVSSFQLFTETSCLVWFSHVALASRMLPPMVDASWLHRKISEVIRFFGSPNAQGQPPGWDAFFPRKSWGFQLSTPTGFRWISESPERRPWSFVLHLLPLSNTSKVWRKMWPVLVAHTFCCLVAHGWFRRMNRCCNVQNNISIHITYI